MTTKAEFKKQLQHRIDAALGELGYSYNRSRAAFVKQTAACEARIGYDITAAGYPKNIVSVDVLVFVDLPEVNRIGETLFAPPAVNPATLWGNLRLFTPANSARDTSYYFDVSGNGDQHVKALVEDLASSMHSHRRFSTSAHCRTPTFQNFRASIETLREG